MSSSTVCLTFDFHALAIWLAYERTTPGAHEAASTRAVADCWKCDRDLGSSALQGERLRQCSVARMVASRRESLAEDRSRTLALLTPPSLDGYRGGTPRPQARQGGRDAELRRHRLPRPEQPGRDAELRRHRLPRPEQPGRKRQTRRSREGTRRHLR